MFSTDQIACPTHECSGTLILDLSEGRLHCQDCDNTYGSDELRAAAARLTTLATWLDQAGELAMNLQKAEVAS